MYFQGQPPPSVNMYWRRFAVSDMPLDSPEEFELWLRDRWYEKDAFIDQYLTTGRFPASKAATTTKGITNGVMKEEAFIESEVKLAHWWEVGNIFLVLAAFTLVASLMTRMWKAVLFGRQ